MIEEKTGDLLDVGFATAHCVAQDLVMGAGVALSIRKKYVLPDEMSKLVAMKPKIGDCLVQETPDGYLFHLVTKPDSRRSRPTYDDFVKACESWFDKMKELCINVCNIPRLGCGLDRLNWETQVKPLLAKMAKEHKVYLTVWNFPMKGNISVDKM